MEAATNNHPKLAQTYLPPAHNFTMLPSNSSLPSLNLIQISSAFPAPLSNFFSNTYFWAPPSFMTAALDHLIYLSLGQQPSSIHRRFRVSHFPQSHKIITKNIRPPPIPASLNQETLDQSLENATLILQKQMALATAPHARNPLLHDTRLDNHVNLRPRPGPLSERDETCSPKGQRRGAAFVWVSPQFSLTLPDFPTGLQFHTSTSANVLTPQQNGISEMIPVQIPRCLLLTYSDSSYIVLALILPLATVLYAAFDCFMYVIGRLNPFWSLAVSAMHIVAWIWELSWWDSSTYITRVQMVFAGFILVGYVRMTAWYRKRTNDES